MVKGGGLIPDEVPGRCRLSGLVDSGQERNGFACPFAFSFAFFGAFLITFGSFGLTLAAPAQHQWIEPPRNRQQACTRGWMHRR